MKKIIAVLAIVSLFLCTFCSSFVLADEANEAWTNGSAVEWIHGYTKLNSSDTRGYIAAPNLDEGPYYMELGMMGLMPGGAPQDGGRWGVFHISGVERASGDNPAGDIYITFPSSYASPRAITVSSSISGGNVMSTDALHTPGVANVFKFAKETNADNAAVLAIYCNGIKVFEGAEQLSLFEGEKLHFTTVSDGTYDAFASYPLFVNLHGEFEADPVSVYYVGPKWGFDGNGTPERDMMVRYTADGGARIVYLSGYVGSVNQGVSTVFANPEKTFDLFMDVESFATNSWAAFAIRPGSAYGAPGEDNNHLHIEVSNGPAIQVKYKKPDGSYESLVNPIVAESMEAANWRVHFELVEVDGAESVKIYINNALVATSANADLIGIMKSDTLKLLGIGHSEDLENPNVIYTKVHTVHTWVDATCTTPKTCSVCGDTEGDALDHNYVNGDCDRCGESDPSEIIEPNTVVWTTGSSEVWDYGYTKLNSSDTRGYIAAPNLDEGPYYMELGMMGLMPGGAPEDGGRWGALHISNKAHASGDNPAGDIYITFPNAHTVPRAITVSSSISGENALSKDVLHTPGVANVFKFAKETNADNVAVLAIYCNGIKVFEGAEQLKLFEGKKLHFTTVSDGTYDAFASYPLFVNLHGEFEADPVSVYYVGPKWGFDGNGTPERDMLVSYTADGGARIVYLSGYVGTINQGVSTVFANPEKAFDLFIDVESFAFDSWAAFAIRPGSAYGAPGEDANHIWIDVSNGPSIQIKYKKPNDSVEFLVDPIVAESVEAADWKVHFELVEADGAETVEIYINDMLVATSTNADMIALLKSDTLKLVGTGHSSLTELPNVVYANIDNTPADFTPVQPGDDDEEQEDPYKDLILTSNNEKVTVEGMLVATTQQMTVAQLKAALVVPEGTVIYVMDSNEQVVADTAVVNSSYSIMMLLDDGYETYVRSYTISAPASPDDDNTGSDNTTTQPGDDNDNSEDSDNSGEASPETGDSGVMIPVMLLVISVLVALFARKSKSVA